MTKADFIGWVANIFFIFGVYQIGEKKISGFYFNTVGNLLYVVQGYMTALYSLTILSIILVLLNIKGIYQWRKDESIL